MAAGSGPVEQLSAVTLVTTDMGRSVAFYEALGFRLRYGGAGADFTSFTVGDGYLNLQAGTRGDTAIWGRIVFYVDDVDAMHARAIVVGHRPDTSPTDAAWGERYFHLRDPDGHELSFARPLPGR